jgi:hypothetical protein
MSDPAKGPVKPTLDDLFAVKRAERPDETFWRDFERGLRQKQLAAIVLPRPWWHAPSLWARKAAPYGGFAAAAAALALAFTTLRTPVAFEGRTVTRAVSEQRGAAESAAVGDARSVEAPERTVAAKAVETPAAAASVAANDTMSEPAVARAVPNDARAAQIAAATSSGLATPTVAVAQVGTDAPAAAVDSAGFSVKPVRVETLVVAPLVALAQEPELVPAAADVLVIEPPAVLQTRHDRVLAKALEDTEALAADDRSLAQVRDRVVHRLADGDELYASITRVGVSGDRLSLKF